MRRKKSNLKTKSHLYFDINKLPKYKRSNSHLDILFNKKLPISKRSQTAIEFIVLFGFVLLSFTIFFLAMKISTGDKIRESQDLAVKELAVMVQDEINLAYQSSDGYYRKFKIPKTIQGMDYEIEIVEELIYVKTTDEHHAIALPVVNVTGQINITDNVIRKEDGIVKLNE